MKLNIIIAVKESGERYVAENKFIPFKFVVVQSGKSARNLHMFFERVSAGVKIRCEETVLRHKDIYYTVRLFCPHHTHTMIHS